jgi:uncharacterized protein involved in copper resistance
MKTKRATLIATLFILAAAAPISSQNTPAKSTDPDHAKHSLAVNLLRAINTAEMDYKNKHGVYASKDALLASDEFTGKGMAWAAKNDPQLANAHVSNGPEVLPGWSLRLNLAADGNGYVVLLEDITDKSCAYAAVTDERGVIRQSKTIGCKI